MPWYCFKYKLNHGLLIISIYCYFECLIVMKMFIFQILLERANVLKWTHFQFRFFTGVVSLFFVLFSFLNNTSHCILSWLNKMSINLNSDVLAENWQHLFRFSIFLLLLLQCISFYCSHYINENEILQYSANCGEVICLFVMKMASM